MLTIGCSLKTSDNGAEQSKFQFRSQYKETASGVGRRNCRNLSFVWLAAPARLPLVAHPGSSKGFPSTLRLCQSASSR